MVGHNSDVEEVWGEEVSEAIQPFRQVVLEAYWQLKCNRDLSLTLTKCFS